MAKGYVGVSTLPYTPLDYIESTGTQYIDTGIIPKSTTRMVLDVALTDTTIANRVGWGSTGSAEAFLCGAVTNVSTFYASVSNNWASVETTVPPDTNRHVWDISNAAVKFDNVTYGTGNIGNTATAGQTLYIFSLHTEYSPYIQYCKEKIYSCQIYDGDTLVRDYIPALDTNNVACLYEKVENKFYYNKGTGTFAQGTAGTVVYVDVARKLTKGYAGVETFYTPLTYIESTGTQYIDTGVLMNQDTGFEIDFIVYNSISGSDYAYVFGAKDPSNRISLNTYHAYTSGEFYYRNSGYAPYLTPNVRKQITFKNGVWNDNDGHTFTVSSSTFSISESLMIFAYNNIGVPTRKAEMRLFSFKLYNGNTLIRDYVPALDYKGVPCLYDKVEEKFYYNEGSGEFDYPPLNTSDYEVLEYAEGTGTQYIDSGFKQSDAGKVEAVAYNTFGLLYNSTPYGGSLFGARVSASNSSFQYGSGATNDFIGNGNSQVSLTKNTNTSRLNLTYTTSSYSVKCGNYSASGNLNVSITTPLNMYVFGMNNNGSPSQGTYKICRLKIYNKTDGQLARDYIPVKRKSDNEICLYDLVNNQFYTNQGTGTFTAGNVIGIDANPVSIGKKARRIRKGYVGVNGVARLCFNDTSS